MTAPALAAPTQAPAQYISTAETSATYPIGAQGAVDGTSALVLSGESTGGSGQTPSREAIFFDLDLTTGQWNEAQSIVLPDVLLGQSGGSIAMEGDIAAIHARTTNSTFAVSSAVFIFERSGAGMWSLSQTLSASFPGADLGVLTTVNLDQGDLIIGDKTVPGARILRRSPGSGTWVEVQNVTIPLPGFLEVNDVVVNNGLLVLIDPLAPLAVFERDAGGTWNPAGMIARPGAFFVTANATDGERIVLPRITDQPQFAGALDIYSRPDPGQPQNWELESTIDLDAGATVGILAGSTGVLRQEIFFESGLIVAKGGGDCVNGAGAPATAFQEDPVTGQWEVAQPFCALEASNVVLDFDGVFAMTGDVNQPRPQPGDLAGGISLVDVAAAIGDCDLDGTPDMAQLASCVDCDLNQNGQIDLCEPTGISLCALETPNSTGRIARLVAFGQPAAGGGEIVFRAVDTSLNTFGFLVSNRQASTPMALGNGFLCIRGNALGRYVNQVGDTGDAGTFTVLADPNAIPTATGPIALAPGSSWVFQGIFRDGGSFQLTDALLVIF